MAALRVGCYMEKLHIYLAAIGTELADAWERYCGDLAFVDVHRGSVFDVNADAVVSPANSFGFMDGGIDRLYLERYGDKIQERVQESIQRDHGGELLVGAATIVETSDVAHPYLIAAPTMRVPMTLEASINPYLAARAIFRLILFGEFSQGDGREQRVRDRVVSVVIPGLGTGVGSVPPVMCAKQVRAAIEDVVMDNQVFPSSTLKIRRRHDKLTGKRP